MTVNILKDERTFRMLVDRLELVPLQEVNLKAQLAVNLHGYIKDDRAEASSETRWAPLPPLPPHGSVAPKPTPVAMQGSAGWYPQNGVLPTGTITTCGEAGLPGQPPCVSGSQAIKANASE